MLLISWSTRPPFKKVLKNRGWQNNWHLILLLVHWHLKSYWCRDVHHVCWYSLGQDKLEMSWQFLWEQFAFVRLWRLESVFTASLKQDWMLRSLMRWVWKQTTLTVRESRRFKTKRKKLDWTRTKFFCLPSLLPRQGNKDLQAQSASTLAVQTPHTVCTVHSHNLFFFPPAVAASENCWFVMLQLEDFYSSPRSLRELSNSPSEAQLHFVRFFSPFAFTHLFFKGLVPPQTLSHWHIWQLGLICAIVAWCDPIVPKMVCKQNLKISFRDGQKESESCKQSIFSHLVHLKWYVKTFKVTKIIWIVPIIHLSR